MDILLSEAIKIARPIMSSQDVTHDWNHITRVLEYAEMIMAVINEKFDPMIVRVGCVLHDISDHKYASGKSVKEHMEHLSNVSGLSLDSIEMVKIKQIIERTSWSAQAKESAKARIFSELKIVRDADRLDAYSKFGILRAFGVASIRRSPLIGKHTITFDDWAKEGYPVKEEDGSLIGHFYAKLFHLHGTFYFEVSREISADVRTLMKEFVEQAEDWRKNAD